MPAPVVIKISETYTIQILNEEMDNMRNEMISRQNQVAAYVEQIRMWNNEINDLKTALFNLFVSQSGSLPPS
jgi:hypothetical protein